MRPSIDSPAGNFNWPQSTKRWAWPIKATKSRVHNSFRNRIPAPNRLSFPNRFVRILVIRQHSMCAVRSGWNVNFRQPTAVLGDDGCVFGLAGQIRPFVRIGLMIVKLFAAIGITDIAPALAANSVVALIVARDRGPLPFRFCILQLWQQTDSF